MWTTRSPASVRNNHMAAPVEVAAPELSGTFRTLLPQPTPKPTEPCLQNLHQHTNLPELSLPSPPKLTPAPELSGTLRRSGGTLRNLPLERTPTHTGTLRNLPEPLSGTCSCNPHQHAPELIWAEDPMSLRCWGTKTKHVMSYIFTSLVSCHAMSYHIIQNHAMLNHIRVS